ncbi:unnamed protein product [Strongylus vulgaris]|uniref:Uncharacterized protein n=1 Tax=Strongylus vulgaris TaxID=40348 RepID=A0A3P7IVM8_STRVU|nr:unnamed protein product [Strongylus vulgaris]
MGFGPKGHVNDSKWRLPLHLHRQDSPNLSTNADPHVLLGRAHQLYVRHLSDGTLTIRGEKVPSRNVGGVGFFVPNHSSCRFTSPGYPSVLCITITIINCYLPTSAAPDLQFDASYEELEEVICKENPFYKFVVGDFSVKIEMSEEEEPRIGRFGSGLGKE